MQRKIKIEDENKKTSSGDSRSSKVEEEQEPIKVTDRRHWQRDDEDVESDEDAGSAEPARPTIIDEYRNRAEEAERKLHEYIEAHKKFRAEQENVRARQARDLQRQVELRFSDLVGSLLASVDHLDLALQHSEGIAEAATLADGVRLARDQFLDNLLKNGIERIAPDGQPFDPNDAEAVRVDPVSDAARDGVVTETLRPGYKLGDNLIRPAQVAVGRLSN